MYLNVDVDAGTVALAAPDDLKAFHVAAAGHGGDGDVASVLGARGAGGPSGEPGHVWVDQAWIRQQAAQAGLAASWEAGFDEMLAFADRMGWIDESGARVHAHVTWPICTARSLWGLLDERVALTPDLEMLCDEQGQRLTYRQLREHSEQVAAGLAGLGIQAGDVVSWILPSWIDAVVLSTAIARLGAVQNPIIPIYREREVAFCARQAKARLLIVPGTWRGFDYTAMAERIAGEVAGMGVLTAPKGGLPAGDPAVLGPPASGDGADGDGPVRWIMYTSGTTADPKGARHTDSSLAGVAHAMATRLACRHRDRSGIPFPFTHIGGIGWMFASLQFGVALLLDSAFDPERTPQFFAREDCTHAGSGTVFHLAYLNMQRRQPEVPLFPSLKSCPGGGAPKPPQLHHDVKRELGGAGVVSGWGLTEAPILAMCASSDPDDKLAGTEGYAMPGVELIAVRHDGTRAAPGEPGELRAKAPQMMKGYLDPALEADAFDEHGYFRTGDLGFLDEDGYVVITGRLKDVIIRNAENISAKEVEDLLYDHPKVADAAVIGLPDDRTGERVCAVVALAPGVEPLTFDELVVHLASRGIRNQAIPEQLELVDSVPRNASGKITKNVLRERFGDRPPDRDRDRS